MTRQKDLEGNSDVNLPVYQVDKVCLLQKFPGKGGWTYAEIPEFTQNKNNPFGWVTVSGLIDGYPLKQSKLQPMGNGKLFLSVKSEIRKKIGKQAGDEVHVKLHIDNGPLELSEELTECFELEDPRLLTIFRSFTHGEQKSYVDWINEAKMEKTRIERIIKMMKRLDQGLRRNDNF